MFSHRYFMAAPVFADGVDTSHLVTEALPRFLRLARFAHDLLGWFEAQPTLGSIKLTCVALPEIEQPPMSVRVPHHFTLSGTGGSLPEVEEYALECLPWSMMGAGVFQLSRSDELVQRYLAMPSDEVIKYQALLYELSMRIDIAFENFGVTHDLGLRSAS